MGVRKSFTRTIAVASIILGGGFLVHAFALSSKLGASQRWRQVPVDKSSGIVSTPTRCETLYGSGARLAHMRTNGRIWLQCYVRLPDGQRLLESLRTAATKEETKLPSRRRNEDQLLAAVLAQERLTCPKGLQPLAVPLGGQVRCATKMTEEQACPGGELGPYDPATCQIQACSNGSASLASKFRGSLGYGCVACALNKIDVKETMLANRESIDRAAALGVPPRLRVAICRDDGIGRPGPSKGGGPGIF
jgi:hypothetical protein